MTDETPLHKTTAAELLGLFAIRPLSPQEEARILAQPFLRHVVGPGSPRTMSQGNPDIALHAISRAACLAGLAGVTLQTPEQRALCGHENMVPVHLKGKAPYYCVDIFEFPNKACELPFVWASPTYAKKLCELQGKRLCSQIEWQLACRADPADGPDTRYAYGDTLDLAVCHTSRRHRQVADKPCTLSDAQTAWRTCSTDTEPSGSFPRCRSRYGVYDQHGNVAEIMMRRDEGGVKSQLKGSAWFYDEVAREVGQPPLHAESRGAYPDHCDFDPRWHVEPIDNAWHVNYHLGFRCCKSVP
ncbi:MAG TPA: SUMF1/EgtB/PvdO family nonheme iron enzyme [Polyangiaceae bacterium]|nr:SUMF1/EgtB/PvdO family nonheme iron enzyme [Polyangiaceae bacterium]